MMLDVDQIRREFPLLSKADPPIYLDSACMSLKPRAVIDAVVKYYEETPFCAGRGVYEGSLAVKTLMEDARGALAAHLGASPSGTVFTKNATEAINLVAHSFPWKKGDVVLTSDREHNSNLVPWQRLRGRGVKHEVVASRPDGTMDLDAWQERLSRRDVRMVAAVHVSNLDGYVAPVAELVKLAHEAGDVRVLLDGAQAASHVGVDLARLGADHYAVSAHKMLGPTGVGALLSKPEALDELAPFITGGNTVARTTYSEEPEFLDGPARFEAGLQNYAGIAGVRPAVELLARIGMDNVHAHGRDLMRRAAKELLDAPGVHLVGAPLATRTAIVPLALDAIDPHALAILLEDKEHMLVRSGDHCLHSWFNAHGVPGTLRASFHVYNTPHEAEAFGSAVSSLAGTLRRGLTR